MSNFFQVRHHIEKHILFWTQEIKLTTQHNKLGKKKNKTKNKLLKSIIIYKKIFLFLTISILNDWHTQNVPILACSNVVFQKARILWNSLWLRSKLLQLGFLNVLTFLALTLGRFHKPIYAQRQAFTLCAQILRSSL